ncbi:hypothetical protein TrST_g8006 [Triparma strigata]|uniref:AAA+ ATPase domain-containing protein n=1 Tax=Triparma strigata TaxID=1606541 RepID=A0A9W7AB55_9STRA|nr:hypothetical protein TrST_g8006 [Triparma strigata]
MSLNPGADRPPPPATRRLSAGCVKLPQNFQIPDLANTLQPTALGSLGSAVNPNGGGDASTSGGGGGLYNDSYSLESASFLTEFLVNLEQEPPPIFGHDSAKKFLMESCVIPVLYPQMKSWKGVLFFGPAGVGKSSLIKSVVYNLNQKYPNKLHVEFFSCSASSLVNKYRGESEKILKGVFECARNIGRPAYHDPSSPPSPITRISIIFIDELDSVFSSTASDESSSRLRVELLKHIDGVESGAVGDGQNRVIVVGATNLPHTLGDALVRRFEKRCYIKLPDAAQRRQIVDYHLSGVKVTEQIDFDVVVKHTEGLSGADMKVMCREAAMGPLRRFLKNVRPDDLKAEDFTEITADVLEEVALEDFERAVRVTNRTVGEEGLKALEKFDEDFGSK